MVVFGISRAGEKVCDAPRTSEAEAEWGMEMFTGRGTLMKSKTSSMTCEEPLAEKVFLISMRLSLTSNTLALPLTKKA